MTVNVTKPALNIREKLAELDKPSGIAGEAMLRADSVQEQRDLIGAGRKNLIINGGMDVWQRGTSHTTGSGYKSVDRWDFNTYTGGAFTVSKETDSELGSYLKWNRTAIDTAHPSSSNAVQHSIENVRYVMQGKEVTVSFWLKDTASVGSGYVKIRMYGSPWTSYAEQNWISNSSDWEYHSFTFSMPASITADHAQLLIVMDDGSSMGGVSITNVQLELGSVATDFEHRSYGEELALCQRYYEVLNKLDGNASAVCNAAFYSSANIYGIIKFAVEKRAVPSISLPPASSLKVYRNGGSGYGTNRYADMPDEHGFRFSISGLSGGVINGACWVETDSDVTNSLAADAEL